MDTRLRTFLLLLALPLSVESQTAIWGLQAGPLYAPDWQNGFGMAAVIGAATEKIEVTGQIGIGGEDFLRPIIDESGEHDDKVAHALLMVRYGRPAWFGLWPFVGTGIGIGQMDYEEGKSREWILPVMEAGVRRRFLYILQAGMALEIQEFRRYHMAVRVNFAVGPFRRP